MTMHTTPDPLDQSVSRVGAPPADPVLAALAAEIPGFLATYGVTLAGVRVRALRGGEENTNLRVTAQGYDLVLRFYRTTAASEVPWELQLIDHLVGGGFPTATVLRRQDGTQFGWLGGLPAALFRFVLGKRPRPYALWAGAEVGRALGSLGNLTVGLKVAHARSRTDLWRLHRLLRVARITSSGDPDLPALVEAVERTLEWVRRNSEQWADLPRGAVHHDAHWDNVLFDDARRLVALLDFDEAYEDYLITDAARLLRLWGPNRPGGGVMPSRALRLLQAYTGARPLTRIEQRWLPEFVLLTSLADAADYVATVLERAPASRPVAGSGSFATYRRLVEDPQWRKALPSA